MRPVPVEKTRFEQTREVMMLDDAEMALSLLDLADTRTIADPRRAPVQPLESPDLLVEYAAAASLILDRAEAEAIAQELQLALSEHYVAA